jgi:general secretion pathway protein E
LAAGAVQSMLAFGVNPFFLSNSLIGILAQRLVRILSPESRKMYDISHSPDTFKEVQQFLDAGEGHVIYGPDESDPKSQDGYVGQTGLFEVLMVNRKIRGLIASGADAAQISRAAVERGMIDFRRAALLQTAKGVTGIEEIGRVVPAADLECDGE